MNGFDYERVIIEQWPDGSKIEVDQWRNHPAAPYSFGHFEIYCGTCAAQVQEHENKAEARILHLEHQLMHLQEAVRILDANANYCSSRHTVGY